MSQTFTETRGYSTQQELWPDRNTHAALRDQGYNQIPLIKHRPLNGHTPQSLIGLFTGSERILLESSQPSQGDGRYSIIVGEPESTLVAKNGTYQLNGETHHGNPLEALADLWAGYRGFRPEGAPLFCGGAVGFLAYESNHYLEHLPVNPGDDLQIPDIYFLFSSECLVVDHLEKTLLLISSGDHYDRCLEKIHQLETRVEATPRLPALDQSWLNIRGPASYHSNFQPDEYMDCVRKVQEYIAAGDTYQLNLSQRLTVETEWDPFLLYRRLAALNPVHFAGFLDLKGFQIVGSSPERLVRLESGKLFSRPIAGTRRRGTPREDERFIHELQTDEKELAEHAMLVDLVRNDLGQVCTYGSVKVTKLMDIVKYTPVIHIESLIEGDLSPSRNCIDAVAAVFPGGTVTGVPKIRTMEIIAELEPHVRSVYTGAIGYLSYAQELDFNMVIRNIVLQSGKAFVHVGGGVVYDSDPYREFKETLNKARSQLEALSPLPKGLGP